MNKVLYFMLGLLAFTSCANTYSITGTTNVSTLDGQKLYLKVLGSVDSVRVGTILLDENNGLPVVLESGDIQVKIDNTQESVTGTPLNDKLTKFRQKFTQLMNQSAELVHVHDQAIMNGKNMNRVNAKLAAENDRINQRMDKLVTKFVEDNFDNVLGPYIFINTCMNRYNAPMLDAWIEDIMSKATEKFKNDPMVKEYYEAAQQNQNIMNGMQSEPAQPQAAPEDGPTPNEMAQPGTNQQQEQGSEEAPVEGE